MDRHTIDVINIEIYIPTPVRNKPLSRRDTGFIGTGQGIQQRQQDDRQLTDILQTLTMMTIFPMLSRQIRRQIIRDNPQIIRDNPPTYYDNRWKKI